MIPFERAFADTERAAESAVTSSTALLKAAKEMVKAAQEGDIGKIHKARERLGLASQAVRQHVANAQSAWPMSPEDEERALAQTFSQELIEAGREQGLAIRRQDDRLVVFPSLLRVVPARRAIQIDKTAVTAIRPSRLVSVLKANAQKRPRSSPDRFIEVLYDAYRLVVGPDGLRGGTTLREVYEALTLMPEVRKEYAESDFGRDLFFLDRSGTTTTKSGAQVSFPTATGTKGGGRVFSFVAPDGEVITYYGIRFT